MRTCWLVPFDIAGAGRVGSVVEFPSHLTIATTVLAATTATRVSLDRQHKGTRDFVRRAWFVWIGTRAISVECGGRSIHPWARVVFVVVVVDARVGNGGTGIIYPSDPAAAA